MFERHRLDFERPFARPVAADDFGNVLGMVEQFALGLQSSPARARRAASRPGAPAPVSSTWNEASSEKIAWPCWIAVTRRVVKRAAVAQPFHLVDDRHGDVARPHEIGMQRMHMPVRLDGALGRHQRLGDRLPAEDALPVHFRAATTIQIVFELLEVEYAQELLHGRRHFRAFRGSTGTAGFQQEGRSKSRLGEVGAGRESERKQRWRKPGPNATRQTMKAPASTCWSPAPAMSGWPRRFHPSRHSPT